MFKDRRWWMSLVKQRANSAFFFYLTYLECPLRYYWLVNKCKQQLIFIFILLVRTNKLNYLCFSFFICKILIIIIVLTEWARRSVNCVNTGIVLRRVFGIYDQYILNMYQVWIQQWCVLISRYTILPIGLRWFL